MPNSSEVIDEMIAWLQRNGVEVNPFAFELPCAGMYRSETKQIFLNEPNASIAVFVLAHEAGHWLGYLIDEKPHSYQRERQAFVYGWWVIQQFAPWVRRSMWIKFDQASRGLPDVETLHLFREPTYD